jgi:serine/threonine protein kinase
LISARIGAGGMGEVYAARDTRLNRTVALKVLSPDLARDAQFRERFNRETQAVAAVNHPHICTVYDAGEATVNGGSSGPIQYLAMEYLEGETLASRLTRGPLAPAEALPVAVQLARALDKAFTHEGANHRPVASADGRFFVFSSDRTTPAASSAWLPMAAARRSSCPAPAWTRT